MMHNGTVLIDGLIMWKFKFRSNMDCASKAYMIGLTADRRIIPSISYLLNDYVNCNKDKIIYN